MTRGDGILPDVSPHGTVVDVVLLTNFSDGVAVLGLETVLLRQRSFLDVLGYRSFHKHLL